MERYYTNDGKDYAVREGYDPGTGKTLFCVYYDGWFSKYEYHAISLYEWAKHCHGNAPSGTPYGYFRANRNGKRIIITV